MLSRFYVKIGFIILLIALLSIPQLMLDSLVGERQSWRQAAYRSIESSWPGAQTLGGPILAVPYTLTWTEIEQIKDSTGIRMVSHQETRRLTAFIPATALAVTGNLDTSIRYRGIYEVPVFSGTVSLKGEFSTQPLLDLVADNQNRRITWGTPEVCVLLTDQRGIIRAGKLQWRGQELEFKPGSSISAHGSGMHAKVPDLNADQTEILPFACDLDLRGMRSMQFALLAENMDVGLTANWAHPGFFGDLLPETRDITDTGFTARWRSSAFSGNTAEVLGGLQKGDSHGIMQRAVGVNFVQPVDVYQQSERSIKYAILFLLLTFGSMVLFELLRTTPLHPVQYILVGFALLIFYLLLISLSEHISFLWAYVLATMACAGLLTLYFGAILHSRRHGLLLGAGLSLLYALLYIILQAEDHALVMGSALLFLVLAALMLGTRHLDWYAVTARPTPAPGTQSTGPLSPSGYLNSLRRSRPGATPPQETAPDTDTASE